MSPFACERCGAEVATPEGRYEAVLEIRHLAEPLEMTEDDLQRDHAAEIRRLLREMARRDPREMEEQVVVRRERRLCARCRAELLDALDRRDTAPRRPPRKRVRRGKALRA